MDKIRQRDFIPLLATSLVTINGVDDSLVPVQKEK